MVKPSTLSATLILSLIHIYHRVGGIAFHRADVLADQLLRRGVVVFPAEQLRAYVFAIGDMAEGALNERIVALRFPVDGARAVVVHDGGGVAELRARGKSPIGEIIDFFAGKAHRQVRLPIQIAFVHAADLVELAGGKGLYRHVKGHAVFPAPERDFLHVADEFGACLLYTSLKAFEIPGKYYPIN